MYGCTDLGARAASLRTTYNAEWQRFTTARRAHAGWWVWACRPSHPSNSLGNSVPANTGSNQPLCTAPMWSHHQSTVCSEASCPAISPSHQAGPTGAVPKARPLTLLCLASRRNSTPPQDIHTYSRVARPHEWPEELYAMKQQPDQIRIQIKAHHTNTNTKKTQTGMGPVT